jgi:hypothetical protein
MIHFGKFRHRELYHPRAESYPLLPGEKPRRADYRLRGQ